MTEELAEKSCKKMSLKTYASKVFKESSVSAVSAIVSTGSIPRKVFRGLIFMLFTAGFLYQCIKFLAYVLEYPTIVSIEIKKPISYMTPAYTFCNYNKIKRNKFCTKYPDQCVQPNIEFCDKYPMYCKENGTRVPKEEYYINPYAFSQDDILELTHDVYDLLKTIKGLREHPEGPFLRLRQHERDADYSGCYSLHARVDSQLDPLETNRKRFWHIRDTFLQFDSEEDEVFNPNSQAGVLLSIHSPFDGANPFEKGIFLKPGYLYKIILSMEEEKLLKYPYKTDCLNYTEQWIENNKSGPRSQEMCSQRCMMLGLHKCFNCTYWTIVYPSKKKYCTQDEVGDKCRYADDVEELEQFSKCIQKCREECLKHKYYYQVQERQMTPMWSNGSITKDSRHINVFIEVQDNEVILLEYKPQYQEVEAFSYIGGFIGIWLGVSLVQVADFLESAFRIIRYFFRKGSSCTGRCCSA